MRAPIVLCAVVWLSGCFPFATDHSGDETDAGQTNDAPLGWSLSYTDSERLGGVVSLTFTPKTGTPVVKSVPAANDPWRDHLTNRTFDLSESSGDATAEAHLTLTVADPSVTIHVTGSASSGGQNTVGGAVAGIVNATWCYRPGPGHQNVRFATSFTTTPAPSVGGENANAYQQFLHVGADCSLSAVADFGTVTKHSDCSSATIDVLVDPDGNACLNGSVDEPQFQAAVGGGDGAKAGGGTASVDATFTITATPL